MRSSDGAVLSGVWELLGLAGRAFGSEIVNPAVDEPHMHPTTPWTSAATVCACVSSVIMLQSRSSRDTCLRVYIVF